MTRIRASLLLASLLACTTLSIIGMAPPAHSDDGPTVVQGVFFFSPTCGHCEHVIVDVLPGIFDAYGGAPDILFDDSGDGTEVAFYEMTNGTVEILLVDATTRQGSSLYEADIEWQDIPREAWGVPRLTMDDGYWVGSVDIPEMLPQLIERGIAEGGMPYPDIPGIQDAFASIPESRDTAGPGPTTTIDRTDSTVPETTIPPDTATSLGDTTTTAYAAPFAHEEETWWSRFSGDPLGNGIAAVVLVGMAVVFVAIITRLAVGTTWGTTSWTIPALALLGLGVAGYLGLVEASGTDAVCGPVGDCNTVQQSEYAELFGIPIGSIGVVGYLSMLGAWGASRLRSERLADLGLTAVGAIAFGGMAFSMYLTFLEPFVIGATCMWCITSAIIITILAWLTTSPGWRAAKRLRT